MRKIILLFLCIALSFVLPSCNTPKDNSLQTDENIYMRVDGTVPEIYDSINFLKAEKDSITTKEGDNVVKLYVGSFSEFAYYGNISSIAAKAHNSQSVIYMTVSQNGEIGYKCPIREDGAWYWPYYSKINSEHFLYALKPDKIFDETTKIYNTYCLTEATGTPGQNLVCFSTNYGEYFLIGGRIYEDGSVDKAYLFSAKDFYEKMKQVEDKEIELRGEAGIAIGGPMSIYDVFTEEELSEFVFDPKE